MVQCYNCGCEVSRKSGTEHKEHIPAQNLFAGYGDEYKRNRITVPSCYKCNNESTHLDEEFRNMIGTISDYEELNAIARNTAKSIVHYSKDYGRLHFNRSGQIAGVKFNQKPLLDHHQKIFKGVFYYQYKQPISSSYSILSTFEPTEETQMFVNYLLHNFNWKYSGHPDVFEYILQPFRENFENPSKEDLRPDDDERAYIGLFKYNKTHAALTFATNDPVVTSA